MLSPPPSRVQHALFSRQHPPADRAFGPPRVGAPPARAGPHLLPESEVPDVRC